MKTQIHYHSKHGADRLREAGEKRKAMTPKDQKPGDKNFSEAKQIASDAIERIEALGYDSSLTIIDKADNEDSGELAVLVFAEAMTPPDQVNRLQHWIDSIEGTHGKGKATETPAPTEALTKQKAVTREHAQRLLASLQEAAEELDAFIGEVEAVIGEVDKP